MTRDIKDQRTADLLEPGKPDRRNMPDWFYGAVLSAMPLASRIAVLGQARVLWTNEKLTVYRNGRVFKIDNPHYLGASISGIAETIEELKP